MTKKKKVEKLIECLDAVSKRPLMYLGCDDDSRVVRSFLTGIRQAMTILTDIDHNFDWISNFHRAVEAHGYRVAPVGPEAQMAARGMSRKDIVLELIRIEQTLYSSLIDALDHDENRTPE